MLLSDPAILDATKGVVKEIMGQAIKSWSFRSGFKSFSLPVNIFLPMSHIQLVGGLFGNVHYLYDAFNAFNPDEREPALSKVQRLERLKYVISFVFSGFFHVVHELKLFNPLLGETLQGFFEDGTEVCVEHIHHSPPKEAFYICNRRLGFKLYGTLVSGGRRPANRRREDGWADQGSSRSSAPRSRCCSQAFSRSSCTAKSSSSSSRASKTWACSRTRAKASPSAK